jgi:hypothetical protein
MERDQSDAFFPVPCIKWKLGQLKKKIHLWLPGEANTKASPNLGDKQMKLKRCLIMAIFDYQVIIHL